MIEHIHKYNEYMRKHYRKLKLQHPDVQHKALMQMVGKKWSIKRKQMAKVAVPET